MRDIEKWARHSLISDPAGHTAAIAGLPSDIGVLSGIIQGVLVHSDWLAEYGLDSARWHAAPRATLPVADRLDEIFAKDAEGLEIRRPPDKRALGTCRDFALMLCSFLRCKGIPSRLRCGFAAYFGSDWEDHWVCEYWDEQARTWRLSDPQLDGMLMHRCRIGFDPKDVPRGSFATAGQVWLDCRNGRSDPVRFGHGMVTGLWFVKVNVVRDHYVLNGREISAWDGWRSAPPSRRAVGGHETALLDGLAAFPERELVEVTPDW